MARRLRRLTVAEPLLAVLALGAGLAGAATIERIDREQGEYRVVQWTTREGLPQNTITDIAFLPNGEMWLATFGGLARFDGHGFRVLDMASDEGLPANRIVALAPAGADSFLYLTQQGHLGRVEAGRSALLVPPAVPSLDPRPDRRPLRDRLLPAGGREPLADGSAGALAGCPRYRGHAGRPPQPRAGRERGGLGRVGRPARAARFRARGRTVGAPRARGRSRFATRGRLLARPAG
jgi:hypothetical protein